MLAGGALLLYLNAAIPWWVCNGATPGMIWENSNESMFPGSEFVDGTVEGAMRAGMKAYPV